jgi:hypothetical protein
MNELQLTSEIENSIVTQLMNGTPLTKICKAKDSPSLSKVYKWIATNKEFADKILTARRIGAQTYLDQMIEELESADNRNIMIVREKLSHYRWLASKLIGVYGDKQEIRTDSKIEITWDVPEVNSNTNTNVIDVKVDDVSMVNSSVERT